jgi:hypothetical protein
MLNMNKTTRGKGPLSNFPGRQPAKNATTIWKPKIIEPAKTAEIIARKEETDTESESSNTSKSSEELYQPTSPSCTPLGSEEECVPDRDALYKVLKCEFTFHDLVSYELDKVNIPGYEISHWRRPRLALYREMFRDREDYHMKQKLERRVSTLSKEYSQSIANPKGGDEDIPPKKVPKGKEEQSTQPEKNVTVQESKRQEKPAHFDNMQKVSNGGPGKKNQNQQYKEKQNFTPPPINIINNFEGPKPTPPQPKEEREERGANYNIPDVILVRESTTNWLQYFSIGIDLVTFAGNILVGRFVLSELLYNNTQNYFSNVLEILKTAVGAIAINLPRLIWRRFTTDYVLPSCKVELISSRIVSVE